jgi:hypothetical protein
VPAYRYQCVYCQLQETRLGGVDDHCALCVDCGHLMLRLDLDFFSPDLEVQPSGKRPLFLTKVGRTFEQNLEPATNQREL